MGVIEANHALDRLSVQMANAYGNGHPWLGCRDLKQLTRSLAQQDGREVLLRAAGEVLDGDGAAPMVGPPVPAAAPASLPEPVPAPALSAYATRANRAYPEASQMALGPR